MRKKAEIEARIKYLEECLKHFAIGSNPASGIVIRIDELKWVLKNLD